MDGRTCSISLATTGSALLRPDAIFKPLANLGEIHTLRTVTAKEPPLNQKDLSKSVDMLN